ncbi:MAG: ribonuclease P [Candidatus Aenigmarchaeota archaeon]|nr:ribonuclease P [Candidatus Aenigmarchaeota archaeon]
MRRPSVKPQWQKSIARERIEILFSLAGKEFGKHPERSHRYVGIARSIGKRYNVSFKKEMRLRFCRKCLHYLKPGKNARVRTVARQQAVAVVCLDCGNVTRFPYRREKGAFKC